METKFLERRGKQKIQGYIGFDQEQPSSNLNERIVTLYNENKILVKSYCGLFLPEFNRINLLSIDVRNNFFLCQYDRKNVNEDEVFEFEALSKKYNPHEINNSLKSEGSSLRIPRQQLVHKLQSDEIKEILNHTLRNGHSTQRIKSNLCLYR
mgnify:CR=1 FL=1